jgi:hypothetical protein
MGCIELSFVIDLLAKILVIVFILHAARYSYKIARWTCARSVQWLTAGFVYIFVWRVIFSIEQVFKFPLWEWIGQNQSYFIIPAYAMWAWGLYLLYNTLRNLGRNNA